MEIPFIYPDGRMSTDNAALYIGIAQKTLSQWRYLGKGPAFVKPTGGRVFYKKADIDAWLNRMGKFTSTSQAINALSSEK